ncbi:hypothetical protein QQS21_011113 [Conoideocrella luteorostrata]|uniref:GET complex subunit GET2 n=1 Tax=Conoideocrella luteorostrata TaxID=1105319 RepID=A0AAJ0CE16_9HYPO|nr:hypothetical protein QQS21_011113 [Conoideocrella luteorostrata]
MTDHVEAEASANDAAAARSAEQARLRKERREAKIKAGGANRLNKITGIGGRVVGDTEQATPVAAAETTTAAPTNAAPLEKGSQSHADPDEIDISQHFYEPNATLRSNPEPTMSEAQLRQMMLGFDRLGQSNPGTPSSVTPGAGTMPNMEDDPMMKMMAQMMGGAGAGGPGSPSFPGMPPMAGMPGQQQPIQTSPYHTIWRLVHALVALSLGLYVTLFTTFSGTKIERETAAVAHQQHLAADDENEHHKRMFFWIFATSEAVLLTTRVILDKGRAPPPGFMSTIMGFIPEPFKGYLAVGLKYGQIFTTVRTDILTCMFVLGVCSWLRA